MKRLTILSQSICLFVLGLCIATATVAQDMAKVDPEHVKVILDNDKVRMLDVQFKAGEKIPMHSHPGYILYSFAGGKTKTTLADGKMVDTEFKAGEARWNDAVTHANEAVTDIHVLVIEMKAHKTMKKK